MEAKPLNGEDTLREMLISHQGQYYLPGSHWTMWQFNPMFQGRFSGVSAVVCDY